MRNRPAKTPQNVSRRATAPANVVPGIHASALHAFDVRQPTGAYATYLTYKERRRLERTVTRAGAGTAAAPTSGTAPWPGPRPWPCRPAFGHSDEATTVGAGRGGRPDPPRHRRPRPRRPRVPVAGTAPTTPSPPY